MVIFMISFTNEMFNHAFLQGRGREVCQWPFPGTALLSAVQQPEVLCRQPALPRRLRGPWPVQRGDCRLDPGDAGEVPPAGERAAGQPRVLLREWRRGDLWLWLLLCPVQGVYVHMRAGVCMQLSE